MQDFEKVPYFLKMAVLIPKRDPPVLRPIKKKKKKNPLFLIFLAMHAYSIILDYPQGCKSWTKHQTQVSSTVEQIKQGFSVGVGASSEYPRTEFLFPRSTFFFFFAFFSFFSKLPVGISPQSKWICEVFRYPDTCPKNQKGTQEHNYPKFPPLVLSHISWQPWRAKASSETDDQGPQFSYMFLCILKLTQGPHMKVWLQVSWAAIWGLP